MIVSQWRELIEALQEEKRTIQNYPYLLEMSDEELQEILEISRVCDSDILRNLLDFYRYYFKNQEEIDEKFKQLKIVNVKDFISEKIKAADKDSAFYISNHYDGFSSYYSLDMSLFKNQTEYLSYLDFLSNRKEIIDRDFMMDLSWILSNVEENRQEVIYKFFQYASIFPTYYRNKGTIRNHMESLSSDDYLSFFDFAMNGYNCDSSVQLLNKWQQDSTNKRIDSEQICSVQELLFQSSIKGCDLPKLFIHIDYEEYDDTKFILRALKRCFKSDNFSNVISDYCEYSCNISNENRVLLNASVRKFIYIDNQNIHTSFAVLLHQDYFRNIFESEKTNDEKMAQIDVIFDKLSLVSVDKKCELMTSLLLQMPFEMWQQLSFATDYQNLTFIKDAYNLYKDREIFDENDPTTYGVIEKISCLSYQANLKIFGLFDDNMYFINDFLQRKDFFLSTLFEKENEPVLGVIEERYLNAEKQRKIQESNQQQKNSDFDNIETVFEALLQADSGESALCLLDDFKEDEEISPNTLIRSLKM